ncbi:hypothetical protein CXF78_00660 [Shewanella sp. 11B5]|jgi:hypothetical protein|uniref:Uncharacterized protein n=1 Tax=Shewanella frigidimarina (strain NCIMB 400) TaxID=318167 RepID=Q086G4_SHEFN|nr:hypothetical protein Sfri_0998 [Shewanella frigidimarina NCIMB 400]PKI11233.1 hypothetical protein CXF78_00660 [Shewanella sp. 11B5]RPA31070.1 hypothetical protein EGC78_12695 [Shewanella frigidimarina]RPA63017.1 hypothetical protein EGC86_07985 [Shewanella frigidimarina]HBF47445.1 hypothetical protein [Shewanella frigidimarina]
MIKAIFRLFIVKPWQRYILWCDEMGLTLENKRSCVPRLSEPTNEASISEPVIKQNVIGNKKERHYD